MKMVRKVISQICVASMCAVALTACVSEKPTTGVVGDTESASEMPVKEDKVDKKEKIELRFSWWGGPSRHEATLAAIDAYMVANPHVEILAEYSGWDGYYQKLVTQLAGGTAADIIQIDYKWIEDLRKQDKFFASPYDFSEILDMSEFSEASLGGATASQELQGVPAGLNAVTAIYNKSFFAEHNIPEDTVWSWDNILEIGKRVNEENPNHYLLNEFPNSIGSLMSRYLNQRGKEFVTESYELGATEEDILEAFQYVEELFNNKVILPFNESALYADKTEQFPKWLNGEIGMFMQEASTIPALSANFEVGVSCIPLVSGASDSGVPINPTNILAINAKGKHQEEVAKFINFMLNEEEGIVILGDSRGVPATNKGRQVLESKGLLGAELAAAISIAEQYPGKPQHVAELDTEVNKIIKEYIEEFGFGEISAEDATKGLIASLEKKLPEFGQ